MRACILQAGFVHCAAAPWLALDTAVILRPCGRCEINTKSDGWSSLAGDRDHFSGTKDGGACACAVDTAPKAHGGNRGDAVLRRYPGKGKRAAGGIFYACRPGDDIASSWPEYMRKGK